MSLLCLIDRRTTYSRGRRGWGRASRRETREQKSSEEDRDNEDWIHCLEESPSDYIVESKRKVWQELIDAFDSDVWGFHTASSKKLLGLPAVLAHHVLPTLDGEEIFQTLIETFMEEGLHPRAWKRAAVVPVSKPRKEAELSAFRPICLLEKIDSKMKLNRNTLG